MKRREPKFPFHDDKARKMSNRSPKQRIHFETFSRKPTPTLRKPFPNVHHYFRVVAANGEIFAAGEGYGNKADRDNAVILLCGLDPNTPVIDVGDGKS